MTGRVLLVDNGSLEPGATLALRELAGRLGQRIGREVLAASLLHSDRIPPGQLGGEPALLFSRAVAGAAAAGAEEVTAVPLFLGPGRSLGVILPEQFRLAAGGRLRLRLAPPLYGPDGGLRRILLDNLAAAGRAPGCSVLLCDHGSPAPELTAVRNALAAELRAELGLSPAELVACSMERRPGPEYAFNEPLLGAALGRLRGEAVVLMQFLLPGRHAGPDGDVAGICRRHAPAGLRWKLSPLVGAHPALPGLLAERYAVAVPTA